MKRWITIALYGWAFFLPFQTRLILRPAVLNGAPWEYGTLSLYVSEVLLIAILLLHRFSERKNPLSENKKERVVLLAMITIAWLSWFWSGRTIPSLQAFLHLTEGVLLVMVLMRASAFPEKLGQWFVAGMTLQAILGIAQFFLQRVFASSWLGMASHLPWELGASVVETGTGRYLRAYGSFPHPNILAAYLVIALVILVWLYERRPQMWKFSFLYHGAFLLFSTALFFTFSRAAWLALAGAGIFWLLGKMKRKATGVSKVGIAMIGYLVFLGLLYAPLLHSRVAALGRLETKSTHERVASLIEGERLAFRHFLTGVGIGNYTFAVYNEVDSKRKGWDYQPVHNAFLLIVAETGAVGLIVFLGVLWMGRKYFPMLLAPLVILLFFDHFLWSLYPGVMLFWFTLGFTRMTATPESNEPS